MSTIRSNFIGPLTGTSLPTLSASPVLMDTKAYNWNSLTTNTYLDFDSTVSSTLSGVSGIPTWVKRITVMFNGVSTNGTSTPIIQLGAGSVTSSGYISTSARLTDSSAVSVGSSTAGFIINSISASNLIQGSLIISTLGSNIWAAQGVFTSNTGTVSSLTSSGNVTLSGTLDRVRITTVNGTDTFDAGSVSVMYE